jgi:hypothetical protein
MTWARGRQGGSDYRGQKINNLPADASILVTRSSVRRRSRPKLMLPRHGGTCQFGFSGFSKTPVTQEVFRPTASLTICMSWRSSPGSWARPRLGPTPCIPTKLYLLPVQGSDTQRASELKHTYLSP